MGLGGLPCRATGVKLPTIPGGRTEGCGICGEGIGDGSDGSGGLGPVFDERLDTLDTEDVLVTFVTVTDVKATDDVATDEVVLTVVLTVPAVEQATFTALTTVFSESISTSVSGPATLSHSLSSIIVSSSMPEIESLFALTFFRAFSSGCSGDLLLERFFDLRR